MGIEKKKNKTGLKEKLVYKGDNTRTLPGIKGPGGNLSRSEGLESDMAYAPTLSWKPGPEQSPDTLAGRSSSLWACDFSDLRVQRPIPTLDVLATEEKPQFRGIRDLQENCLLLHLKGLL